MVVVLLLCKCIANAFILPQCVELYVSEVEVQSIYMPCKKITFWDKFICYVSIFLGIFEDVKILYYKTTES